MAAGGRERAEVVAVDLVPEGTLARLVQARELEVDPASVGEEQPVESDGQPALVPLLARPGPCRRPGCRAGSGSAADRPNRTGPKRWRAPARGNSPEICVRSTAFEERPLVDPLPTRRVGTGWTLRPGSAVPARCPTEELAAVMAVPGSGAACSRHPLPEPRAAVLRLPSSSSSAPTRLLERGERRLERVLEELRHPHRRYASPVPASDNSTVASGASVGLGRRQEQRSERVLRSSSSSRSDSRSSDSAELDAWGQRLRCSASPTRPGAGPASSAAVACRRSSSARAWAAACWA